MEKISWTMDADIHNDRTQIYHDIHLDEKEVRALFEIPQKNENIQNFPDKPKKGRPPTVPKEQWLEEIAILFLTGKATEEDNIESLTNSLKTSLSDNHNKKISEETIRKDWLRPLFKIKKERNGGK